MNSGSRGGSTVSLAQAQEMFRRWKPEEFGWLKARILLIAKAKGEFHGDFLEGTELSERSIIGATVNSLVRSHLLVSTGEHRRSRTAAGHARRSYVYVLTVRGRSLMDQLAEVPREELPVRPESVRSQDHAGRQKSRRKIVRQEGALFEEGGYDDPKVEVSMDEQDVSLVRNVRPVDVPEFLDAVARWEPYLTDEEREYQERSPFRVDKPRPLSWDAE